MTEPGTESAKVEVEEEFNLAEWWQKNSRTATIAGIVALVIVAGIWLYLASARRKEAFAQAELGRARATAESGNLPLATNDLSRLVERFGGTRAGDEAAILLNQIRLLQGQNDVAVNALTEFVAGSHPDDIEASGYALLAGGLEQQSRLREAGAAWKNAANAAELDFLKASYLNEAGRTLAAAGDTTGAREAYSQVLNQYGIMDAANEARVRMAEIGGEVPPMPRDTSKN